MGEDLLRNDLVRAAPLDELEALLWQKGEIKISQDTLNLLTQHQDFIVQQRERYPFLFYSTQSQNLRYLQVRLSDTSDTPVLKAINIHADLIHTDADRKVLETVIEEVDTYFQEWRTEKLTQIYKGNHSHSSEEITPEKIAQFLQQAGSEYNEKYPSPYYYRETILPTVLKMASTPEQVKIISHDAIECLEKLLRHEFSYGTSHRTSRGLIQSFFLPTNERKDFGYRHPATGQFRYFYENYGKYFTEAVAIYQGWECDRYYGDGDYSNDISELERKLKPSYLALPSQYRDQALHVFAKYGGYENSFHFWREIDTVVKSFIENGKEELLEDYFWIALQTPDFTSDGWKGEQFPLLSAERSIKELEHLHALPAYREEALNLAGFIIKETYHSVTFEGDEEPYRFRNNFSIKSTLDTLQANNDLDVSEILSLPMRYPWLGEVAKSIIEKYIHLHTNYPGGVDTLIQHLSLLKESPLCMKQWVSYCNKNTLSSPHLSTYIQIGAELVSQVGNVAANYFNPETFSQDPFQMLEEGKDLKTVIQSLLSYIKSWEKLDSSKNSSESIQVHISDFYLGNFNEPHLDTVLRSLNILNMRLQEEQKSNSIVDKNFCRKIISQYLRRITQPTPTDQETDDFFPYKRVLNASIDFQKEADIIMLLGLDLRDHYLRIYSEYSQLTYEGVNSNIAMLVALAQSQNKELQLEVAQLETLPKEIIENLSNTIIGIQVFIRNIYQNTSEASLEEIMSSRPSALQKSYGTQAQTLQKQLMEIARFPELSKILHHYETKLREIMHLAFFKEKIFHIQNSIHLPKIPFLEGTNDATRVAVTGSAFLIASGSTDIPHISPYLKKLRTDAAGNLSNVQYDRILMDNMRVTLPYVVDQVLRARNQLVGLMPIGAKVHTQRPMDARFLDFIVNNFHIRNTPFTLIHAQHSLVLPPLPSALENKMLIQLMAQFGMINTLEPDIQVAMAGRWNRKIAALVGASILLSTDRGVIYKKGAFSTTHDGETGARLMAYDAGVRSLSLPFDVEKAPGRTDMLGRHSYADIYNYQLLGTLATHLQYGGILSETMNTYIDRLLQILEEYNLIDTLEQSAWVFDHAEKKDSLHNHENMINKFTQTWVEHSQKLDYGIIKQVNLLLQNIYLEIERLQPQIIAENPLDFQKLQEY